MSSDVNTRSFGYIQTLLSPLSYLGSLAYDTFIGDVTTWSWRDNAMLAGLALAVTAATIAFFTGFVITALTFAVLGVAIAYGASFVREWAFLKTLEEANAELRENLHTMREQNKTYSQLNGDLAIEIHGAKENNHDLAEQVAALKKYSEDNKKELDEIEGNLKERQEELKKQLQELDKVKIEFETTLRLLKTAEEAHRDLNASHAYNNQTQAQIIEQQQSYWYNLLQIGQNLLGQSSSQSGETPSADSAKVVNLTPKNRKGQNGSNRN